MHKIFHRLNTALKNILSSRRAFYLFCSLERSLVCFSISSLVFPLLLFSRLLSFSCYRGAQRLPIQSFYACPNFTPFTPILEILSSFSTVARVHILCSMQDFSSHSLTSLTDSLNSLLSRSLFWCNDW